MNERIARARQMLRTPFLHQGRDRNGVDCVGLLAYAMEFDVSQIPSYPKDPFKGKLEQTLTGLFGEPCSIAPVSITDLKPGDFVAMQYRGPARHVGLIGDYPDAEGELSLIHTDSILGEVTEHRLDEKWLNRISFVWRV